MSHRVRTSLIAGVIAVPLAGFGVAVAQQGGQPGMRAPQAPQAAQAPGQQQRADPMVEQQLIQMIRDMNQHEIELASMAREQTQNEQVREYAQQLEQDHQQFIEQLDQAAPRATLRRGAPGQPWAAVSRELRERQAQAIREYLEQSPQEEFDQGFLGQQILAHLEKVEALELAQERLSPPASQVIQQTIPKIQDHREQAERLMREISREESQASAE